MSTITKIGLAAACGLLLASASRSAEAQDAGGAVADRVRRPDGAWREFGRTRLARTPAWR